MYHFIDTLVTNRRATVTVETECRQHRREEKGINLGSLSHDRKSALVSALLEEIKCEIFEHSMYSTDLAPSDYHLFLHIKNFWQAKD